MDDKCQQRYQIGRGDSNNNIIDSIVLACKLPPYHEGGCQYQDTHDPTGRVYTKSELEHEAIRDYLQSPLNEEEIRADERKRLAERANSMPGSPTYDAAFKHVFGDDVALWHGASVCDSTERPSILISLHEAHLKALWADAVTSEALSVLRAAQSDMRDADNLKWTYDGKRRETWITIRKSGTNVTAADFEAAYSASAEYGKAARLYEASAIREANAQTLLSECQSKSDLAWSIARQIIDAGKEVSE